MNIAEKTNEVLEKLQKDGYKGYKVRSVNRECIWHNEYSIFQLGFNVPRVDGFYNEDEEDDFFSPPKFDSRAFYADFANYLREEFPKCTINHYDKICEFEIIGPNNKRFYQKYMEALEALAVKYDKHLVIKIEEKN